MNTKNYLLLLVPVIWLLLVGCQGNPTVPGQAPDLVSERPVLTTQPHQLLGYFDLVIDKEAQTVELTPVRTADLHLNLTGIFNAFNSVGIVFHPELSDLPAGLVVVDFVITHPFPTNPELSAFDMKAILYSAGTLVVDTALVSDVDEPQLLNADGYTRWWNPTEFTNATPFGYIESEIPHSPVGQLTATVNPYKLFADVLGVTDTLGPVANEPMDSDEGRAVLRAGSACTRRMEISFPMSPAQVIYGIGIDCSWDVPVPNPPVAVPDDFPIQANQPEAYRVHMNPVLNSLYYDNGTASGGGFLEMEVNVWDWQGQQAGNIHSEIASVTLYSPALWTGGIAATYDSDTGVFAKYVADLTGAAVPTHVGPVKIFAKVQSVDGSYNQVGQPAPTDALSSWQALTLDVPEITCTGDSNNAWAEAVEITPGTPIFDQICNVGDYNDYFFFTIPANNELTGNLRMECSASNITLGLYDNVMPSPNLIQEVTVTGGNGVIPVSTLGLFPGTYNIWIHNAGTQIAPYKLELTGAMVDTTPLSPVDVTPAGLYMEPLGAVAHDNWLVMPPLNTKTSTWWIYDTTNPSSPNLAATFDYEYLGVPIYSMVWPDCYIAYYDGADCWIDLIDFTNPTAPVLTPKIAHIIDAAFTPTLVQGMTFDDNYLYVSVGDGVNWWLVAYDRTDFSTYNFYTHAGPADIPAFLQIMDVTGWSSKYMVVLEYGDDETFIFDITDPISVGITPTQFGSLGGAWQAVGLKVREDKVMFLGFDAPDGKFAVLNVSSAGLFLPPIPGAVLVLPSGPSAMALDPNLDRAYISNVFQGLTAVDFNAAPFIVNNEPFFQNLAGFGVEYANPNLVIVSYLGWGGFEVIDVSDVGDFQTLYHSTAIDNPQDVAEQGDYLFVLDSDTVISGKATIKTVDISVPQNAEVVAEYWIDEATAGPICLDGNILAVTMPHGFKLLDVSNPLSLTTFSTYSLPADNFYAVGIWDHYLFAGVSVGAPPPYWVQAWDITDPAGPVAPPGGSGIITGGKPLDILFNNDSIFVNQGIQMFSASLNPDPLNPALEAFIGPTDAFERMKIENNMLYVIDKYNFEIYDITDPAVFAFQGNVAIPNNGVDIPTQMDVEGLFAFTSASPLIQSFNVWPSATPAYVAQVSDTEFFFSSDLLEYDGFLYQSDVGKGIRIYDLY